ncbi:type VII secretion integral membrane protein EccD [Corynebacterium choanae]|uniref:EccD-like transmembrane domain-containing protein n=1 Tax=Corynebacterium choanae TaxID=1862358 RepID=A0A3G6J890_9CORY|nr:type VII secretion integral membrane protein EccD [Corynebacterium choanae]AZA14277.1 hypothetical protein CCHOA_09470 [Corynebacterium choanae]
MTMSVDDQGLRVTVEVIPEAGQNPPAVDMVLPPQARLVDILPEVLELAGCIDEADAWVATTASGWRLDPAVPLTHTPLGQGGRLMLTHQELAAPPLPVDAAEAFTALPTKPVPALRTAMTCALGWAALAVCVGYLQWWMPLWARCGLASLVALTLGAWLARSSGGSCAGRAGDSPVVHRSGIQPDARQELESRQLCAQLSSTAGVMLAVAAGWWWLIDTAQPHYGSAIAVGCLIGLGAVAVATITGATPVVWASLQCTLLLLAAFIALLARFTHTTQEAAALAVVFTVLVATVCPGWCLSLAGLQVPTVGPTAETMPPPPKRDDHTTAKARTAQALYTGMLGGCAVVGIPAMLLVGAASTHWVVAMLAAASFSVGFHGMRLHSVAGALLLHGWALAGIAGIGVHVASVSHQPGWLIVVMVALTGGCVSAPLFTDRLTHLSPPALRRLEQLEMLGLVTLLPIGLFVAGIYTMVRGL